MPKILNDVENRIIETARKELLAHPDHMPSVRLIAARTNISVGTIYNYFPGKEELLVKVLIDDWHNDLDKMDENCRQADNLIEGIEAVYQAVQHFNDLYSPLFENLPYAGSNPQARQRHVELRSQLKQRVDSLIDRFCSEEKKKFSTLYTETLISAATEDDIDFQQLVSLTNALFA